MDQCQIWNNNILTHHQTSGRTKNRENSISISLM